VAAGKRAFEPCLACHAAGASPANMVVPLLQAQPDNFIQWQLVYFRTETRKDPVMSALAGTLADSDIRNLGAYLSSQPPPAPPAAPDAQPELTRSGALLARQHRCAVCHQDGFVGKDVVARLAGQREDYLLKALRDFKSGARRGGGIAAMPDAVFPLSDADMQALAHFLSRLP
jgi:cytochrome c553